MFQAQLSFWTGEMGGNGNIPSRHISPYALLSYNGGVPLRWPQVISLFGIMEDERFVGGEIAMTLNGWPLSIPLQHGGSEADRWNDGVYEAGSYQGKEIT